MNERQDEHQSDGGRVVQPRPNVGSSYCIALGPPHVPQQALLQQISNSVHLKFWRLALHSGQALDSNGALSETFSGS